MWCRSTRISWSRDPFGGELVRADDGTTEVWGRGASTCSTPRRRWPSRSAASRPRFSTARNVDLYFGVADEEAGGSGEPSTCSTADRTPSACMVSCSPNSAAGLSWVRRAPANHRQRGGEGPGLDASARQRHTGHGSMPYGSDNALDTAAEVVRRLAAARPGHTSATFGSRVGEKPRHTCRLGADAH